MRTRKQTLGPLGGLVVVDETQHLPPLFRALRPIIDRAAGRTRFLLLGSVSPTIVKGVSESLAGRIGLVDLAGFDLGEIGPEADWRILWERGGFPRSYLQPDAPASWEWRENFIRTFLERDLPATGENVPAAALRRFWSMTAHYHGQTWNAAELARALGRGETLAKRYLDLLVGAFVVRALPPWFENLKKRQVGRRRCTCGTPGCCTPCSGYRRSPRSRDTPRWVRRSRASPSNRSAPRFRSVIRVSGRPTPVPNSICW